MLLQYSGGESLAKGPGSVKSINILMSFIKSPHSVKTTLPFAMSDNAVISMNAPPPPGRISRRDSVSARESSDSSSIIGYARSSDDLLGGRSKRLISARRAPKILKGCGLQNTRSKQRSTLSYDASSNAVEITTPSSSHRRNRRNEASMISTGALSTACSARNKSDVSSRGRRRSVSTEHVQKMSVFKGALEKTRSNGRKSIKCDDSVAKEIANVLSSGGSHQRNENANKSSGRSRVRGRTTRRSSTSDNNASITTSKGPALGVKSKRRSMPILSDSVLRNASEDGDISQEEGGPGSTRINNKFTSHLMGIKGQDEMCKEKISHGDEEQTTFQINSTKDDHDDGSKKTTCLDTVADQELLSTTEDRIILHHVRVSDNAESANAKVQDMVWVEPVPPFRKGLYTGPIDKKARPHGYHGTWVVSENNDYLLSGSWYKGV